MFYVFAIFGLLLAAGGILCVVVGIRSILSDDSKLPLFFQSFSSANKTFAGFFAVGGGVIAVLGGWMAYKAFTGG